MVVVDATVFPEQGGGVDQARERTVAAVGLADLDQCRLGDQRLEFDVAALGDHVEGVAEGARNGLFTDQAMRDQRLPRQVQFE